MRCAYCALQANTAWRSGNSMQLREDLAVFGGFALAFVTSLTYRRGELTCLKTTPAV
jgi:hypothetical protein